MYRYYLKIKELAFSATAKDTYILFIGNLGSAFWGFVFTLIVARALPLHEFGIFSAVLNLVIIISSLSDIGVATGAVNFISEHSAKGESEKVLRYIKASFLIRFFVVLLISFAVIIFSPFISQTLLASGDKNMAIWSAFISIFIFPVMLFPYILQARRKFMESVIYDNSFYLGRLIFAAFFFATGTLTMTNSFVSFGAGFLICIVLGFIYIGTKFIFSRPGIVEYKNLLKFSGWLAVNRIISSVSGRLDIQMLAAMMGAVATGLYSIPSRLASFIIVLAGSYSAVLATRFASFSDIKKEREYTIKSTVALIPIILLIIFWIIFAEPFVLILFGDKFLPAVPVFKALAASQIPFLLTVPPVTAIIYAMKKTVYIGALSFFQLGGIFFLNYYLIPKYGIYAPTITFAITNTLLATYVWYVVIRNYWFQDQSK